VASSKKPPAPAGRWIKGSVHQPRTLSGLIPLFL